MRFVILAAVLSTAAASAQSQFLQPEGLAAATGYSHVVVSQPGKMVFIAGQVSYDAKGNLVGRGDLKAQTEQVFANLRTALRAAGATFDHVVKMNWYIRDYKPANLPVIREVRNRYINPAKPPASTLVGVAALAQDDFLVEVEAVAIVPPGFLLNR